jgi:CheY-like chemotaxis protein
LKLTDARILVVDDEPILLELFEKWLRKIGCGKVFTAANGKAALSLLQLESFDLLVSDVRMPAMDGITLVRCLSEVGKTLPGIIFGMRLVSKPSSPNPPTARNCYCEWKSGRGTPHSLEYGDGLNAVCNRCLSRRAA